MVLLSMSSGCMSALAFISVELTPLALREPPCATKVVAGLIGDPSLIVAG